MRCRFQTFVAILAVAIGLVALFALTGCAEKRAPATPREQKQTQNVAHAKAGMDALRELMPVDVQRLTGPQLVAFVSDIAEGASAFAEASAGDLQIPASEWTPAKISADPTGYRQAGQKALRVAKGVQWLFLFKTIGGTIGSLVVLYGGAILSKELPGIGPIIASLGEAAWGHLTDAKTKEEDEARTTLAAHASTVLEVAAAALPPGEAQRAVAKLPPEVVQAAARIGIALPANPSPQISDAIAGAVARAASVPVPMPTGPTST